MNEQSEITLYRCNSCPRAVFKEDIEQGIGCRGCGSRYVREAAPTFRYVASYLFRHPRLIPRFVIEDVLGLA